MRNLKKNKNEIYIYGKHTVLAALKNPARVIKKLYVGNNSYNYISDEIDKLNAKVRLENGDYKNLIDKNIIIKSNPKEISKIVGNDAIHQGIVGVIEPYKNYEIEAVRDDKIVLALDNITDPQNVGAIIRSAAAFGIKHIVITKRNSPKNYSLLAKSASGGMEFVDIVEVVNLSRAISTVKDMGFYVIGLDSEAEISIEDGSINTPVMLIMGSEHTGLRELTRKKCDMMLKLDIPGAIKSLNVSNACAILLYSLTK